MTIKVLIVDDHEVARAGIAELVQAAGFKAEASVSTGQEALTLLDQLACDVVLLDVRMPNDDGLATLERIRERHSQLPVVVFSAYDNPTYIARATALGAQDYLLKSGSLVAMQSCLQAAVNGLEPPEGSPMVQVQNMMRQDFDLTTLPPEMPLTAREAQVLRHVALGLSNKEIARSLSISVETVKEHVQNILRKINACDRTDAAVRAVKLGIAG